MFSKRADLSKFHFDKHVVLFKIMLRKSDWLLVGPHEIFDTVKLLLSRL